MATGSSPLAQPPTRWSEQSNLRWKTALPGRGSGTPILWNDLIFVLTASAEEERQAVPRTPQQAASLKDFQRKTQPLRQRFSILALKRSDGSLAWQALAASAMPHEPIHDDGTWASSSAVTDGEHVFAYFGSHGLYAYDLTGKQLWEKQLGPMSRRGFGEGSSPTLHGETLLIQRDHDGDSALLAFDKRTGDLLWSQARDEKVGWATPLVVEFEGKPQVITNGSRKIRSYELKTGRLLWECAGMTPNAVPSPVHRDGIVYLTSGFNGSALLAIQLAGAQGDISATKNVLWKLERHTPYVPSPLLMGDQLYFLKANGGILSAANLKTGQLSIDAQRLSAIQNVYASPVGAAGHVYVVGRDGDTEVFEAGRGAKAIAINHLDDVPFASSPALAGDAIYLRGERYLYCIAAE